MKNVTGKYKISVKIDPKYREDTLRFIDFKISPLVVEYSHLKWFEGWNDGFSTVFDLSKESNLLEKVLFSFDYLNTCITLDEFLYKDQPGTTLDDIFIKDIRDAIDNIWCSGRIQKDLEIYFDKKYNNICSKFTSLVDVIAENEPKDDKILSDFYWEEVDKNIRRFNPQEWDSDIYENS